MKSVFSDNIGKWYGKFERKNTQKTNWISLTNNDHLWWNQMFFIDSDLFIEEWYLVVCLVDWVYLSNLTFFINELNMEILLNDFFPFCFFLFFFYFTHSIWNEWKGRLKMVACGLQWFFFLSNKEWIDSWIINYAEWQHRLTLLIFTKKCSILFFFVFVFIRWQFWFDRVISVEIELFLFMFSFFF